MISKKDVVRVTTEAFDALYSQGGSLSPEECDAQQHDAEAIKAIVLKLLRNSPADDLRRKGVELELL